MLPNDDLSKALVRYRQQLEKSGAKIAKVMREGSESDLKKFESLNHIELHPDLITYFMFFGRVDDTLCDELGIGSEPIFAWGMSGIELQFLQTAYALALETESDAPDYWPAGFVPFLSDGSGSYVVLNCIQGSPTYGAVYDMSEGVGCNRISSSLQGFIDGCRKELELGIRTYDEDGEYPDYPRYETYLADGLEIYGETPYFIRAGGRMGEQIVDWLP
jgi:hypothetical protein